MPATSRPSSAPGRRRSSSPTGSAARWRASSSRRSTSSPSTRPAASSSPTSWRRSARTLRTSTSAYARSKNLTPYDVLKIASMIEKETVAPSERQARRGGDLQPAAPEDAARDRRHAALRPQHPGHRVADQGCDREQQPVQQPEASRACRRRRSRIRASPRSRLRRIRPRSDYLYYVRIPGTKRHFFTASESGFLRKVCEYGYACS